MNQDLKNLLLIIAIFISAVVETDIYLPAFPDMMLYFEQTEQSIQKILTWNFLGLCLSGPVYGPLSDIYGRKKPLMFALGIFLVGSLCTTYAVDYDWLLLGRVLQGLGSGGCFTLGTAIIFDVFQEKKAINALNKINIIVPIIMAGAPLLGGFLNQYYGFRANFYAITFCVLVCFVSCALFLEESLKTTERKTVDMRGILRSFRQVLTHRQFLQLTAVVSLVFAGFLVFISSSAVLFVVDLGVSKSAFPFYQFSLLLAYLLASLTCTRLVSLVGVQGVKRLGLMGLTLSSVAMLVLYSLQILHPIYWTLAMLPYACGFIWVQTPYVTEVMELMPDIKGIAASMLTSLRLLMTAGVVGITAHFYNRTILPVMCAVIGISIFICYTTWRYEKECKKS